MNPMVSAADVALLRELERLREENQRLHEAALTFGALAEGLSLRLPTGRLETPPPETSVIHHDRPVEIVALTSRPFEGPYSVPRGADRLRATPRGSRGLRCGVAAPSVMVPAAVTAPNTRRRMHSHS
jgi:hypothetical protein